ncbi:MAG TPA: SDR family NAD(P)-dependent oxidoreductase [Dyella sp.]|uniref:SDR family NAD(P)-dependent oxidoreductase n=1 Tax=Dyella sp. TaxID=1869338 RepID=UPI002CE722D9|nr:SDR family NAD(P)-dependent oxidoreductase [Dyella sp.]HUB89958.1 SDR family NAD(P)-dependent oxidoreductase [Dyella sp.]
MTTTTPTQSAQKTALLIGASRGLGYAMAEELLKRAWHVMGTVRGSAQTPLHALAQRHPGRVDIEHVDITMPDHIAALRSRLDGRTFDLLFVNAGVTNNQSETIGEVSTEEFTRVMVTNALSPMRVLEALYDRVADGGTIGVMSSGQGSVANNTNGMREVYRGSKAALNMFMRSFAARHGADRHPMVLMAPGWVRTDMGGSDAPLTIEDSIPNVVNTLLAVHGNPGLQYLDYLGRTVPW